MSELWSYLVRHEVYEKTYMIERRMPSLSRLFCVVQVEKVVKEAGVMCFVAFQRRFDANFMRLKEGVVNGEVGDVHMMHITSRDPSPPPIQYIKVQSNRQLHVIH